MTAGARKGSWMRASVILAYALGVGIFYFKYVPLVPFFQAALVPILAAAALLTAVNRERGLLLFVFVLPLINNLPYFFGIAEPAPHAPTALVLFLFYFLGWLVHGFRAGPAVGAKEPVFKPMTLAAILIVLSAGITFFRYSGFFPFRSDGLYELKVNAHGVTSGGAFMSIIFFALSYLSGFAFFFTFVSTVRSLSLVRKILAILVSSSLLSLAWGMVQHSWDLRLGNNPISIYAGIVNATFKDALSFGCFLSMAIPLFLGFLPASKGWLRLGLVLNIIFSAYLIFFAGSKSGFIALLAAFLLFLILGGRLLYRLSLSGRLRVAKIRLPVFLAVALVALAAAGVLAFKTGFVREMKSSRTLQRLEGTQATMKLRLETHWKSAFYCIKDYPLTGVGIGAYIIESSNYAELHQIKIQVPESAENYFLQVTSELGAFGLILFLWIFWDIIKKIRKAFRVVPARLPEKWLLIGATAGLFAYAINIQTHSYIGSFEIAYVFWMLAGLVFSLARLQERGEESPVELSPKFPIDRRFRIFAVLLLTLYGAIHFWNSTHSLSPASRIKTLGLVREFGLDRLEKTGDGREFRWTRSYGGLPLHLEKQVLIIPLHASHPDINRNPVKVRIYLVEGFFRRKIFLKDLTLTGNEWLDVPLYRPDDVGRDVILLFKVSRTWNPLKVKGVADPRNLGVAVGKIRFRDAP